MDVRIIAATNADLETLSDAFYYRLARLPIHIPALRDRPADIEPLVSHIIPKMKKEYGIINEHTTDITPQALNDLKSRHWGGNIRELENVIMRALVRTTTDKIQLDNLPTEKQAVTLPEDTKLKNTRNPTGQPLKSMFENVEQELKKLVEEKKLCLDGDSDIQDLAAVILKSGSKQNWPGFCAHLRSVSSHL